MFWGITLILLSLLAAPSLFLSKKPDAARLLAKITPYQGWIGLIFCLWGIWGIISALLSVGLVALWPIWWFTWLIGSIIEALLGFLLGYGLIAKYVLSKSEAAKAKAEQILAKLAPVQGTIAIIGIIVGLWMIIASFLFLG